MVTTGTIKLTTETTLSDSALAQNILDNLNTAVILLDSKLCVRCMNPAAEMLFSVSQTKLVGLPVAVLMSDTESFEEMQASVKKNHPFTRREHQIEVKQKRLSVDFTVTPIRNDDNETELLLELNQLDRHLQISHEDNLLAQHETVQALLKGVAHEVKNPLGGIRGAAQLLERELLNVELKEYTQVIIEEADRLKKLVDRMLSPHSLPNKTRVNIHFITERVRSLLKADKSNVNIKFDYDPSIPKVNLDPEHLIQAVLNIVKNAAQALTENPQAIAGEKQIIIKTRVLRRFNIGPCRHKLVARMDIIDNGPGISEEMKTRIFMPLITGRAEGTGLGLSIAQSLVSQNGGLIECQSRPGRTVFSLLLPIDE
jgi:two-component system nitrogen regulation sensor histidine kinase GlnL